MELKQSGPSASALPKKLSLHEDFDQDFLTSWKSGNIGDDLMDFGMETLPNKGKMPFDFGKLDDFDLGGNFNKISSFKVGMPEIDFSSPPNKPEKPKEKTTNELGKQGMLKDKFSFAFEFNELDRFSLDSDLLREDKKCSTSQNGKEPSSSDSELSKDSLGISESQRPSPCKENTAISQTLVHHSSSTSCPLSFSDPVIHAMPNKPIAASSPVKEKIINADSKNECCNSEQPRDPESKSCLKMVYPPSMGNDIEKLDGASAPLVESKNNCEDGKTDVQASLKNSHERVTEEKLGTNRKLIPLELNGLSNVKEKISPKKLEHKAHEQTPLISFKKLYSAADTKNNPTNSSSTNGNRMTSLDKLESRVHKPTETFLPKQLFGLGDKGIDEKNSKLTSAKCDPISGTEQIGIHKSSIPNTIQRDAIKSTTILGSEVNVNNMDGSRSQITCPSMPHQIPVSTTPKTNTSKSSSIFKYSSAKGTNMISTETQGFHLKDGKTSQISSSEISRKSMKCDLSFIHPSYPESNVSSSVLEDELALLSSPLKRKAPEESMSSSENLDPSKRFMESHRETREVLETISENGNTLIPETQKTSEAPPDCLYTEGVSTNFNVEGECHIDKAEACSRDLDNICSRLKKMNSEAKELLVRAIVNNNSLLMLNHPMLDHKIINVKELVRRLRAVHGVPPH